VERW